MISAKPAIKGMRLSKLLGDVAIPPGADRTVQHISANSRTVSPGCLFFACAGRREHGLNYLGDAVAAGAAAIAWEPAEGVTYPGGAGEGVPVVSVPDLAARLGEFADRFYSMPSAAIKVAGVTGTNGKTTCVHLIAQGLEQLGKACGQIGTLGTGRPGDIEPGALTTPDAIAVHRTLRGLRDDGADFAAMEVSSHALDQGRVNGVRFETVVFTNLSRDHLDYHGDMERYGRSKGQLFAQGTFRNAVINVGDNYGRRLIAAIEAQLKPIAVSVDGAELTDYTRFVSGHIDRDGFEGVSLRIDSSWGCGVLNSPLIGRFNAGNLCLALAVLVSWGSPFDDALAALGEIATPPGRMELVPDAAHDPRVIVDYAHTPAALEAVLDVARSYRRGQVWLVFGCGGDRDRGKRAEMGRIAGALAGHVVLTDDNPRSESPAAIVADIRAGITRTAAVWVEHDRRAAIQLALGKAAAGDVVVIAGKGHETTQQVGDQISVFDDRLVVAELVGDRT